LNSQGATINIALEKLNCQKAGETLAEVWGEEVIDNFPVISEWRGGIKADEKEYPSQEWLATHVRASQYFLQIVKYDNEECCALPTSSLKTVLRERFFLHFFWLRIREVSKSQMLGFAFCGEDRYGLMNDAIKNIIEHGINAK